MKNGAFLLVVLGMILTTFCSCISTETKMLSRDEMEKVNKIDSIKVDFTSFQMLHIRDNEAIGKKAYAALMEKARQDYTGNIDVVNVTVEGSFSIWGIWTFYPCFGIPGNVQKITATGDVIALGSVAVKQGSTNQQAGKRLDNRTIAKLEKAVNKVSGNLIKKLPKDSTIAVINVSSDNRDVSLFVTNEVEFRLVDAGKFKMVDRKKLDAILSEQELQMSGLVSDSSAVSIGEMTGASIVITGEITKTGSKQRLNIKALDVKTAQIVTMARESF